MEDSEIRSPLKAAMVWVVGVACTVLLWLVLTPGILASAHQRVPVVLFFAIPVVAYAALWQNRLRKDYLFGDLPKTWSRSSLFRVLGEKATYGQKVVYFQIALLGYLASAIAYTFPIVLLPLSILAPVNAALPSLITAILAVTFAGMLSVLAGDALAVYLLSDHPA